MQGVFCYNSFRKFGNGNLINKGDLMILVAGDASGFGGEYGKKTMAVVVFDTDTQSYFEHTEVLTNVRTTQDAELLALLKGIELTRMQAKQGKEVHIMTDQLELISLMNNYFDGIVPKKIKQKALERKDRICPKLEGVQNTSIYHLKGHGTNTESIPHLLHTLSDKLAGMVYRDNDEYGAVNNAEENLNKAIETNKHTAVLGFPLKVVA